MCARLHLVLRGNYVLSTVGMDILRLAMLDHTRFVYWLTILFSTLGYAIHIWIIPIGFTFRSGFNLDLLRLDG